jgi:hypothetical protein
MATVTCKDLRPGQAFTVAGDGERFTVVTEAAPTGDQGRWAFKAENSQGLVETHTAQPTFDIFQVEG